MKTLPLFRYSLHVTESNKGSEVLNQITLIIVTIISLNISIHEMLYSDILASIEVTCIAFIKLTIVMNYSKSIYCTSLIICMGFVLF